MFSKYICFGGWGESKEGMLQSRRDQSPPGVRIRLTATVVICPINKPRIWPCFQRNAPKQLKEQMSGSRSFLPPWGKHVLFLHGPQGWKKRRFSWFQGLPVCSKSKQTAVKEERTPTAERDKLPAILLGARNTQLPGAKLREVPQEGDRTSPWASPLVPGKQREW